MNATAMYVQALRDINALDREVQAGFEAEFLASAMTRIAQYGDATRFSAKQRAVIRRMTETYLTTERAAELDGQLRLEV